MQYARAMLLPGHDQVLYLYHSLIQHVFLRGVEAS